jgi:hypothetical protein
MAGDRAGANMNAPPPGRGDEPVELVHAPCPLERYRVGARRSRVNVHGVDFSGAAEPGCKTWITSGTVADGEFRVAELRPAAAEFGVTRRAPLLEALRGFLADAEGTTGLDFSFGLPRTVLAEVGAIPEDGWAEFLAWFRERFEGADAPGMQETLREWGRRSGTRGVEHRRRTDDERAANSPYSNITRYQTLHGIRDVLAPLVAENAVSVRPMAPVAGVPTLLEIYPAATLRDLGLPDRRYKEPGTEAREKRERILDGLRRPGMTLPERFEEPVLDDEDGDALDSLVAAVATANAVDSEFEVEEKHYDPVEGYIYA